MVGILPTMAPDYLRMVLLAGAAVVAGAILVRLVIGSVRLLWRAGGSTK
jgi:hypothetical protein